MRTRNKNKDNGNTATLNNLADLTLPDQKGATETQANETQARASLRKQWEAHNRVTGRVNSRGVSETKERNGIPNKNGEYRYGSTTAGKSKVQDDAERKSVTYTAQVIALAKLTKQLADCKKWLSDNSEGAYTAEEITPDSFLPEPKKEEEESK
jgi:hypothetical protein